MSYQAQNLFGLLYVGGVSRKAILQACANYADDELRIFVKTRTLAGDTDQSEATARRRLHELEDLGLISRFPQWVDDTGRINKENRGRRINDEMRLNSKVSQDEINARAKKLGLRWRKIDDDSDDGGSDESGPSNLQGQTETEISPPNSTDLQGAGPSNSDDLQGRPLHCGKGITSSESKVRDIDDVRAPLISKEALQLSDECVRALGFGPEHPPNELNGLAYQTSIWLARGYDPPRIVAAFARFAGQQPIKPLTYFMKVVETECTKPPLVAPSTENPHARTETIRNGFAGRIATGPDRSGRSPKERRWEQAWDNVNDRLARPDDNGGSREDNPPAAGGLPQPRRP